MFHRGLSSRLLGFLPRAVLLPLSARSPRSELCGNKGDVSPLLGREPIEVEVLLRHQSAKGKGGGHIEVIADSVITKFEHITLNRPFIDVARFCSGGGNSPVNIGEGGGRGRGSLTVLTRFSGGVNDSQIFLGPLSVDELLSAEPSVAHERWCHFIIGANLFAKWLEDVAATRSITI